jgi:hypothetical protein
MISKANRFGGFMSISYANTLKDTLYWWLGRKRPFVINDEYKLELLFIDKENNSVKIKVTNLKNGEVITTSQAQVVHE